MSIYTIKLKLYKPSKRKCEIIDEAMFNYSLAYQYLLEKAYSDMENIKGCYRDGRGMFKSCNIVKWIDKNTIKELNRFSVQPFKDSLKIDFANTIASYLSIKEINESVSYPVAYLSDEEQEEKYKNVMKKLLDGYKNISECESEIEKYIQKNNKLKPIYFCRYAANRNYCLLHDVKNNKYFAKIYLLNVKSDKRESMTASANRELRYIYKGNEIFEGSSRKECYILFPLSFGKRQEEYLKEAIEKPEIIRTARLIKENNGYFLSVNIHMDDPEEMKTTTYMGIARGIMKAINYTIAENNGRVRKGGFIEMPPDIKSISINLLHNIANSLVQVALENKSQVIMQKLVDKGDRLKWQDGHRTYTPILNCYYYNRLFDILNYKLRAKGLPAPLRVSSVNIFYTCPDCGMNTVRNRFSNNMFICTACGKTMDVEYLGSLNLARKLVIYKSDAIEMKLENTSNGIRFINKDIGLEYYPSNPYDCVDEFRQEIQRLIKDFYKNISIYAKDKHFKKKYSLIKKLQGQDDFIELLKIVQ